MDVIPPTKRRRLNYDKCESCRKDKKGCEPTERSWPAQKCNRCSKMGLACSPNQRTHLRSRPAQPSAQPQPLPLPISPSSSQAPENWKNYLEDLKSLSLRASWAVCLSGYLDILMSFDTITNRAKLPSNIKGHFATIQTHLLTQRESLITAAKNLMRSPSDPLAIYGVISLCDRFCSPRPVIMSYADSISGFGYPFGGIDFTQMLLSSCKSMGSIEQELSIRYDAIMRMAASKSPRKGEMKKELERYFDIHTEYVSQINAMCGSKNAFAPRGRTLPLMNASFCVLVLNHLQMPDTTDWLRRNLLHVALDHRLDTLEAIVIPNRHINSKDALGRTPLHIAAAQDLGAAVNTLLSQQANPLIKDQGLRTPWHWAAALGNASVLDVFLKLCDKEKVKNVLSCKDCEGNTPIILAAKNGHPNAVNSLLRGEYRDTVNLANANGETLLPIAAEKGYTSIVQNLLKMGTANPDSRDSMGRTPFSLAVANGHIDIAKMLLDESLANPNLPDGFGVAPLSKALCQKHKSVIEATEQHAGPAMLPIQAAEEPNAEDGISFWGIT